MSAVPTTDLEERIPLTPEEGFMESVKDVARSYIGDPVLANRERVACDPILQLAVRLTAQATTTQLEKGN